MMPGDGMMQLMQLWWLLLTLVFMATVIGGVYLLARSLRRPSDDVARHGSERASPMHILEERYARGEMSDEEFEHRRRKLEEPPSSGSSEGG